MPENHISRAQIKKLREKAKTAATNRSAPKLSAAEFTLVTSMLRSETDQHALKVLIETLGYTGETSQKGLLERFLNGPSAFLASEALFVLCEWWGFTSQYRREVRLFIEGVPWDSSGMILRDEALYIAGNYLAQHTDPDLLETIIMLCKAGEDDLVSSHGCDTLHYVMGGSLDRDDQNRARLIEQAELRLARERATPA
jgi:hypothetical protein